MSRNGWYEIEGSLYHFINYYYHNEKSPAVICNGGAKLWLQNNKYHRLDGSAIEYSNGKNLGFIKVNI